MQIGDGGTTGSVTGDILDDTSLVFDRSDTVTYDGVISGGGSADAKWARARLILTGSQRLHRRHHHLRRDTGDRRREHIRGSITGNILDNAALIFNRSDAITYGGLISGTGGMTQLGTGTLILTANNTYTGGTTISDGTLQIGNGGATGSVTGDILDNAALAFRSQ